MSGPIPDNALLAWLQVESNDEFRSVEALTAMYAHFVVGETDPIDKLRGDDRHHCYLVFVEDSQREVTGLILHHLAQFPERLGVPATPYDGRWFITGDQPVGGNHITYLQPLDLLTEVDPAQCYKVDRIQRELTNLPDATSLVYELTDANVADLEMITTRRGMWIPNQYAHLCLGGLSPADIWTRVYGLMLTNGHTEACKPLVEFLQYQLQGGANANVALFDEATELEQPRSSTTFLRHRNHILSHLIDAPAPQATGPTAPPGTQAGAAGSGGTNVNLGGMTFAQLQALIAAIQGGQGTGTGGATAATGQTTPTNSVAKRWAVDLDTLLKLCLVSDVSHLPPVWEALARGPRKEERQILQAALNNQAASAGAATRAKLVVTKELHATVVNLVFWSGDMDMLDEGIHPFRTVYTSASKQAQDQARLRTYDSLAQDGNLRLEDVELFQLVLKSHWPTDFLQLDTTLKFFQNLLIVLLPATHPLTIAYINFIGAWNGLQIPLAEYFALDPSKPALFLRSIQLRTAAYWQQVTQATAQAALIVPAPDYRGLLSSLLIQSWVLPTMPGTGLGPLLGNPHGIGDGGTVPRSEPPAPRGTGQPGPAPTPAPAPAPSPAPRQVEIRNPNVDAQIAAAMSGRTFRISSLFNRTVRPPKHDDGTEVCCSYHWRGRCSSGCGRKASHRPLTEAERVRNLDFLQEHVVNPDLGRAAAGPDNAPGR